MNPPFDTPKPIHAVVDVAAGTIRIEAERRADTWVGVNPLDPASDADATAAGLTEIDYQEGHLKLTTPRGWRSGAVEVKIQLPEGSSLDVHLSTGELRTHGRLSETKIRSTHGNIHLDQTAALDLESGSGDVCVAVTEGPATIKIASGDLCLGETSGNLHITTTHGRVVVARAHADAEITTKYGDIEVGEVARGQITLTASGNIQVGVKRGSAAHLSLASTYGTMHNHLQTWPPPEETVEIQATATFGNVQVKTHTPT
ncbi:DUF4097 family beta strand repeat-containing protein [Nonomuraea sp. NPDC050790]|uniref:DUF4097 family beta strand repeat-containing protein n=1 Tax=Nonomuraea sp. NPDC050790 TaxID=3364371 RepID=UPI003793004F